MTEDQKKDIDRAIYETGEKIKSLDESIILVLYVVTLIGVIVLAHVWHHW